MVGSSIPTGGCCCGVLLPSYPPWHTPHSGTTTRRVGGQLATYLTAVGLDWHRRGTGGVVASITTGFWSPLLRLWLP